MQGRSGMQLLYLTGDKNRDTITRMLSERSLRVEPLQVYETHESLSFEHRLSAVLQTSPKCQCLFSVFFFFDDLTCEGATHWWLVYFAPSSASFVTPILKNYLYLQEVGVDITESSEDLLPTRIAVIGPTTHAFLIEQLHLRVDAVAEKPAPKDLVSVVQNFDRNSL